MSRYDSICLSCYMINSKFCPVLPVVGVFPISKDGNYTLEYGRYEKIECASSNSANIIITKSNKTGSFTSKRKYVFCLGLPVSLSFSCVYIHLLCMDPFIITQKETNELNRRIDHQNTLKPMTLIYFYWNLSSFGRTDHIYLRIRKCFHNYTLHCFIY